MTAAERALEREVLLSFWKAHILYHASKESVYGHWIAEELRRHGYAISPGTLYPLLSRLARHGWLRADSKAPGAKGRRGYRLTPEGRKVLAILRERIKELHREVVLDRGHRHGR
ncbi:MAG: helix-turn-helix transcriptional regulator [Elusimicrobia bacterium]|nr:helix-turn-helix transcriptional regulator [Elusimicrobiota bacterium]